MLENNIVAGQLSIEDIKFSLHEFVDILSNFSDGVLDKSLQPKLQELLTLDLDTAQNKLRGIIGPMQYFSLSIGLIVDCSYHMLGMMGWNDDKEREFSETVRNNNKEKAISKYGIELP